MINTLTELIDDRESRDPRINPRTRDLDCRPGFERSEEELDTIRAEIQERTILELANSALMFNEPQFYF
jgi:hypothetical protein